MEKQTDLYANVGLTQAHWAVIKNDITLLEKELSAGDASKTSDILYTWHDDSDSRIFVAGDTFFPPEKITDFPLKLNFDKGSYPLHFAAATGGEEAITLFIKHKSNLNVQDGIGATPLHLACLYGHLEAAKLLLNSKTKINQGTKTRKSVAFYDAESTAVHAALSSGNLELVKWLIDNVADVHLKTKFGCDAYFFAARGANPEVIQLLASHGVSVPKQGLYGNFPLLEAVKQNSYNCVAALLKLGSPVMEPQGHQAPLLMAIKNNYLDIRELLINHGAKPLDYKGNLSYAAGNNDTVYINEYFQDNKDINVITDGSTALMNAAAHGRMEAAKLLLDLGADVNANPRGTALHWALANNRTNITNLLLDYNPDCSAVDDQGNTVLLKACLARLSDPVAVCKRMISLGANPHTKSRHGVSAYSFAKQIDDKELLTLYKTVSETGATDLSYKQPKSSTVLENLSKDYDWKKVYAALWKELVPPNGAAHTVQGELLRSIGKLSDEYYRNGNGNWDGNKTFYLDMIAYLKTHLLDGSTDLEKVLVKEALVKLTHFNVLDYDDPNAPHEKITEAVVQWCVGHKKLIEK